MSDLIYDVGLHAGEDSLFYLLKGFRVVAVDANPAMCRLAGERLARFVETGQLRIVNAAIADRRGRLTFFENTKSDWSTLVREWDAQNVARGSTLAGGERSRPSRSPISSKSMATPST